jgi:multidrug efflux pump subunit AcrB
MFSRFFIDRPVFASVISIVIVLCGGVALYSLPVEQSPEITPPTVQIQARYPGANAETVAQSIAAPIEQELSGIENLLYFDSQSANDGSLTITLTFEIGSDQDIAAVEVQNRLKRAEPRLPAEVIPTTFSAWWRLMRRTASTTTCSSATTPRSTCWIPLSACRAWVMFRSSGRKIIRCASGLTQTSWPPRG